MLPDKLRLGSFRGGHQGLIIDFPTEADVFPKGVRHQEIILEHNAHVLSQFFRRNGSNVPAPNADFALIRVILAKH